MYVSSHKERNNCRRCKFTKNVVNNKKKEKAAIHLYHKYVCISKVYVCESGPKVSDLCLYFKTYLFRGNFYYFTFKLVFFWLYNSLPAVDPLLETETWKSFSFMFNNCCLAFCFIASSNLRPFNGFINFGNNQKSHGARSRLYWGCRMQCFITNSWTSKMGWAGALCHGAATKIFTVPKMRLFPAFYVTQSL